MAETIPVEPGQVWADNDWRQEGRVLRVISVDERFAHCRVIRDGKYNTLTQVGRRTRLSLHRMRPTSTGYRLVADVATEYPDLVHLPETQA